MRHLLARRFLPGLLWLAVGLACLAAMNALPPRIDAGASKSHSVRPDPHEDAYVAVRLAMLFASAAFIGASAARLVWAESKCCWIMAIFFGVPAAMLFQLTLFSMQ